MELTLFKTQRGKMCISYRGFTYNERRRTDRYIYWRCRKRSSCKGTMVTKITEVGPYDHPAENVPHSHPPSSVDSVAVPRVPSILSDGARQELIIPGPSIYREAEVEREGRQGDLVGNETGAGEEQLEFMIGNETMETDSSMLPLFSHTLGGMERATKLIDLFGIKSVRFEQSDVYGIPHCKLIPVKHFRDKAIHGQNFCLGYLSFNPHGEPIDGTGYGEEIHYEDAVCFPDLATFQILPWLKKTARVLVEGVYEGKVVEGYPRVVARRQLERLEELGFSLYSAHEFEFYLVDEKTWEPCDRSINANATSRLYKLQDFTQDVLEGLPHAGVDVEFIGTESAKGQIEITYRPSFGIRAADNAHTYKMGMKEIAQKHGYTASFMSKPWPDKSGSSAHFCHSLWDVTGETPLLYDPSQPLQLSKLGKHWVAGLQAHACALAVLMGPTVNCLKRYKPFSFAPSNATWGMDNRTCAIRVKIQGPKGTYIENRMGASACNPYITLAATIAAGIDGIIKQLPLPPQVSGDAYKEDDIPPLTPNLPNDMAEAVECLLNDEVITSSLGHDFIQCFVAEKRNEIKLEAAAKERGEVEKWEREYFFEVI